MNGLKVYTSSIHTIRLFCKQNNIIKNLSKYLQLTVNLILGYASSAITKCKSSNVNYTHDFSSKII